MIAAIIAMLVTATDPVPPIAVAAAPPSAAKAEKTAIQTARDNLDQTQQIYTQSCGDRAYGAYDDLCEQLSIQVRRYRTNLDKLEREAAKPGAEHPRL